MRLILNDPNGKEVASVKLRPNKWGSFTHTFAAPADRLTGSYRINAWYLLKDGRKGEGFKSVNIEEYKRPKFTASFEGAPEKAELGKPVTVTGKALTYSGLPVQHAKVRSTADLSGDPSFEFTVTAHVTDDTGEVRSAAESFEIGTVQWRASVWAEGNWHTPEKGVPVRVTVSSLAGAKLPVKGTLKAFRLVAPDGRKQMVRKLEPRHRCIPPRVRDEGSERQDGEGHSPCLRIRS